MPSDHHQNSYPHDQYAMIKNTSSQSHTLTVFIQWHVYCKIPFITFTLRYVYTHFYFCFFIFYFLFQKCQEYRVRTCMHGVLNSDIQLTIKYIRTQLQQTCWNLWPKDSHSFSINIYKMENGMVSLGAMLLYRLTYFKTSDGPVERVQH